MTGSGTAWERDRLVVGRYRLLHPLGTGGSAHVWAARDESLGREVALKVLTGAVTQGGRERERLGREARLLAALDHPRITTVFDFAEISGRDGPGEPFLVTELLDGESLGARLKRGPLPPAEALAACAQVADALAAAHGSGVVHRDVKPGNVMLTPHGAVLFDFGISRRETETADLTGQVVIGTPACMAPEQWRGLTAQPATDVYALGCLLYWCLSGQAPYHDRELAALGMAHLTADPPALPLTGRDSAIVHTVYRACMRKDPADRPSAAEVAATLDPRTRTYTSQSWIPRRRSAPAPKPRSAAPTVEAVPTAAVDAMEGDTDEAGRTSAVRQRPRRRTRLVSYAASAGAVLAASITLPLTQIEGGPSVPVPRSGTSATVDAHTPVSGASSAASPSATGHGAAQRTTAAASPTVTAPHSTLPPPTTPAAHGPTAPHGGGGGHGPGHGKPTGP